MAQFTLLAAGSALSLATPGSVREAALAPGWAQGAIGAVPTLGGGEPGTAPMASEGEQIPRQIWTFWNTPYFPPIVAACVSAMHTQNPEWTVRLLGPNANEVEPPPPGARRAFEIQPALEADWYRVSAIARYGGVWMDSTMITNLPLGKGPNPWPNMYDGELQGFNCPNTDNQTDPVCLESFVFAARPATPLVVEWKNEFAKALTMGCQEYGDQMEDAVVGNLREHLPYLCVYAAFQQAHANLPNETMTTYPSQGCKMPGGHCGPYNYLDARRPEGVEYVDWLFLNTTQEMLSTTPIIKFQGPIRNYLTEHEDLWYNNQSYVGKILVDALPSTPYEGQLQLELPPKPSKEA